MLLVLVMFFKDLLQGKIINEIDWRDFNEKCAKSNRERYCKK